MTKIRTFSLIATLGIGLGSTLACGGAPPPEPKAKPPAEFAGLAKERKALLEEYASIAEPLREKCEFSEGECLMHARDERYDILGVHVFPECDSKRGDEKMFCEEDGAAGKGLGERLVGYYKQHTDCLNTVMQCTAKLLEEAEEARRIEVAHQRRTKIESMSKSEALHVEALTMQKSVTYMRSTLPPSEEGTCQNLPEAVDCRSRVAGQDEEFKTELLKDDGEYDEAAAADLYQSARSTEVTCPEPELSCLYARAQKYGATPETQRFFKRNVEIIKQRERLSLRAGGDAASRCESAAVAKYQGDIISAYKVYVRQPVLFFRNKLHGVFLKMHRSQVDCLRQSGETSALGDTNGQDLHAKR